MSDRSSLATSNVAYDVYVIIDQGLADSRSLNIDRITEEILRAGPAAVQYRAKNLSKAQYYRQIQSLLSITRNRNIPLFINDHLDIALALSADGIHLGQNDLPFEAAAKLLPREMILGVSTHSEQQAALAAKTKVGYIAIGPAFPTTTKANPDPVVGLKIIQKVKKRVGPIPLIAIGGISLENAEQVILAGADAVAVASAVILSDDPAGAVSSFKKAVLRAKASRQKEKCKGGN